jgi:hypothetical protein
MSLFKTPCLEHVPTAPTMDTILSDVSITIAQTAFTFTDVHSETKNLTNHD